MAGARSINFCTYMHVDKKSSSAYIGTFVHEMRSNVGTADYTNRQDVNGCQADLSSNDRPIS